MLLYLDTCCLNRPFDDQTQSRVFLETESVLAILARITSGYWRLACSAVLLYEVSRIADQTRQQGIGHLLGYAEPAQPLTSGIEQRAAQLCATGFKMMDALHLASAEALKADAFLTTDDRLLTRAQSVPLSLPVSNPTLFKTAHP
jgi:predicted nucleic acid-binding protein